MNNWENIMPYYIVTYKEEVTYECRLHASCESDAWKLIGNREYDTPQYSDPNRRTIVDVTED
jgi:hypothetical protein